MNFAQHIMIVTAKNMTQQQIIDALCKAAYVYNKDASDFNKRNLMFFATVLSVHNSLVDKTADQAIEEIKEITQMQSFFAKN